MVPRSNFGGDQGYFSKKAPKDRLDVTAMSRHVADATQRVAEMGAAGQLVHVFFCVYKAVGRTVGSCKK